MARPRKLLTCQYNDTWTRDFGPLTVESSSGGHVFIDYTFNAWGGKYNSALDDAVTKTLHAYKRFNQTDISSRNFVLEGGAIESDGQGNILTTAACLLNPNRNPELSRREIENELSESLGALNVLWLEDGYLSGDDTDSHIDTLARFAPNNTIVYVACDDPNDEHYDALKKMERQLEMLRSHNKLPYRLIPLPWPSAKYNEEEQRLPATYANYLITNGAVLVPIYQDKHDALALAKISSAYPGREIIGIDCSALIEQHGSLHCITMQIPLGAIEKYSGVESKQL